jgi:hypothetical protein
MCHIFVGPMCLVGRFLLQSLQRITRVVGRGTEAIKLYINGPSLFWTMFRNVKNEDFMSNKENCL